MALKSLDDLRVYQEALEASEAISALLDRDAFRRDAPFRTRLAATAERVAACIGDAFGSRAEGRAGQLFGTARRTCNDMRVQLAVARGRNFITDAECAGAATRYERLGRRLTRLVQELRDDAPRC